MINYTVLGQVTASQDSWTASLQPLHRLLLAILIMERGAAVPRQSLVNALWDDEQDFAERPLTRVVSELRTQLRVAQPASDPLPIQGDTYRLELTESQADVLRFRAKISQAGRASEPEATQLRQQALREWGDNAIGLFGGQPLTGLRGRWAEGKRDVLRREYCDARLHCLWQEFRAHQYERVVGECVQLANVPDALHEEKFVALWMIALYRVGARSEALNLHQRAIKSAQLHLDLKPSGFLGQIAEFIRVEDTSKLNGPADLLGLADATDQDQGEKGQPTGEDADGKAGHAPDTGPSRRSGKRSGGRSRNTVINKVRRIEADKVVFGFEASGHD